MAEILQGWEVVDKSSAPYWRIGVYLWEPDALKARDSNRRFLGKWQGKPYWSKRITIEPIQCVMLDGVLHTLHPCGANPKG